MYTAFRGYTNFIFWDRAVRGYVRKGSVEKVVFELNLEFTRLSEGHAGKGTA